MAVSQMSVFPLFVALLGVGIFAVIVRRLSLQAVSSLREAEAALRSIGAQRAYDTTIRLTRLNMALFHLESPGAQAASHAMLGMLDARANFARDSDFTKLSGFQLRRAASWKNVAAGEPVRGALSKHDESGDRHKTQQNKPLPQRYSSHYPKYLVPLKPSRKDSRSKPTPGMGRY